MISPTTRLAPPKVSNNSLNDVIEWIKMGDCVVLHENGKYEKIYHQCIARKKEAEKEITASLDSLRVIYFNVAPFGHLLHASQWPYFINDSGFHACHCDLKNRITKTSEVPHSYHLNLD